MKLAIFIKSFFLILLISSQSIAKEKGIGVNITRGGGCYYGPCGQTTVYLPIKSGSLIVEPSLSFHSYSDSSTTTYTDYNRYNKWEESGFSLGVGLLETSKASSDSIVYYGARLGYKESGYSNDSDTIYNNGTNNSYSSNSNERSGFFITPTIGAEYLMTDKLGIGIDFGYRYQNMDTENIDINNGTVSSNNSGSSTNHRSITQVILRHYF